VRRTFRDFRLSRGPQVLGDCASNISDLLNFVNEAQERLINVGGESGWWGGWTKVAFTVSRTNPFITLPPQYARIINLDVCRFPIRIQNEFYEELDAGIGLRIPNTVSDWCGALEGFERGVVSTTFDVTPQNQFLRIYFTDPSDGQAAANVIFSGALDQNGNAIYSQVGNAQIQGLFLTLPAPGGPVTFTQSAFIVTGWNSIQKDVTNGDVLLTQVDATTGNEVSLSRFAAWETNPAYRRYYINSLPCTCCPTTNTGILPQNLTVTAMCKYEYVPVARDSDPLIISNIPALIEETQAIKYSSMDSPNAAGQELKHHRRAVKLLQDEMRHYLGELMPAVNFAPFGTAKLEHQRIGLII